MEQMEPRAGFKKVPAYKYNFNEIRECVSIEEMANILGIEINSRGSFKGPCHNDQSPSAALMQPKGKYADRCPSWHCFACNITGSVIELVAYAIGAAEFVNEGPMKGKLTFRSMMKACDFIAQYHPEIVHSEQEATLVPEGRPRLTSDFLKEIGLKYNPYFKTPVRFEVPEKASCKEKEESPFVKDDFLLSEEEATLLVLNKIEEQIDSYFDFEMNVLATFPNLDTKAREEIRSVTKAKVSAMLETQKEFLDYLVKLNPDIVFEPEEFDKEEEER